MLFSLESDYYAMLDTSFCGYEHCIKRISGVINLIYSLFCFDEAYHVNVDMSYPEAT